MKQQVAILPLSIMTYFDVLSNLKHLLNLSSERLEKWIDSSLPDANASQRICGLENSIMGKRHIITYVSQHLLCRFV